MVLEWIEAAPPPHPMSAQQLHRYWSTIFGQDGPRTPGSLGCLLRDRVGVLGDWRIGATIDRAKNSTIWSIERTQRKVGLTQEEAVALLRALVTPGDQ